MNKYSFVKYKRKSNGQLEFFSKMSMNAKSISVAMKDFNEFVYKIEGVLFELYDEQDERVVTHVYRKQ